MDRLIVLHNVNVKIEDSVDDLKKIEDIGQTAYETFVNERLVDRKAPVSQTILMNNLFIFNTPKERGKKEKQITNLKNEVFLFSRLFTACQNRDGDLDDFFKYENQEYPPSISQLNELRSGNKSELLKHLEEKADSPTLRELRKQIWSQLMALLLLTHCLQIRV